MRALRKFVNPRIVVGGGVLLILMLVAITAAWISPYDPTAIAPEARLAGPSAQHWLGTDDLGRDVLSRLIHGARLTFVVAVPSVLLAVLLGVPFGVLAGYFGGLTEAALMRVTEVLLAFPPIVLGIFVVTFLGASLENVILVVGILFAPTFARIAYGSTLSKKAEPYVEAARSLGSSSLRIMATAILPNILAPIVIQMSLTMGMAILLESSLSFLGLGPPPPDPSWGRMVGRARPFMMFQPLFVVWPSVIIAVTIIAANLLGDGLRDALDPKLRGRH